MKIILASALTIAIVTVIFSIINFDNNDRGTEAPGESVEARFEPRTKRVTKRYAITDSETNESLEDLDSEISRALAEKDKKIRARLLKEIAEKWALTDSEACFEWALNLPFPSDRSNAVVKMLVTILDGGEGDVDKAISFIDRVDKGELKDDAIIFSFDNLVRMDLVKATKLVSSLSGQGALSSAAYTLAEYLVSENRIVECQNLIEDLPFGSFRDKLAVRFVSQLAVDDQDAAFMWLQSADFDSKNDAYRVLATAYAASDPENGLDKFSTLADESLKRKLAIQVGIEWAKRDPEEAGDWLVSSSRGNEYNENNLAANAVISRWLQWDHEAPFKKIETVENVVARDKMTIYAIEALSEFDPETAASKLSDFSERSSLSTVDAAKEIAVNWLERDPLEASSWIGGLDRGPTRDATIDALISKSLKSGNDLVLAREWAELIQSQEMREHYINLLPNLE